jgi:hypothetical protein
MHNHVHCPNNCETPMQFDMRNAAWYCVECEHVIVAFNVAVPTISRRRLFRPSVQRSRLKDKAVQASAKEGFIPAR